MSKEKQIDTFYVFSKNVTTSYGVGKSLEGEKCFLFYCYQAKLPQERRDLPSAFSLCKMSASEAAAVPTQRVATLHGWLTGCSSFELLNVCTKKFSICPY